MMLYLPESTKCSQYFVQVYNSFVYRYVNETFKFKISNPCTVTSDKRNTIFTVNKLCYGFTILEYYLCYACYILGIYFYINISDIRIYLNRAQTYYYTAGRVVIHDYTKVRIHCVLHKSYPENNFHSIFTLTP